MTDMTPGKRFLCLGALLLIFAGAPELLAFAGGDGSIGNPYQIANVQDLQDMKTALSAHYIIINNIDASATVGWNGGQGFEPITANFNGTLDGQGFTVSDLTINWPLSITGVFRRLSASVLISDVTFANLTLDTVFASVGGLAGISLGADIEDVTLTNCMVSTNTNQATTGGLVGDVSGGGTISNCHASGQVQGGTLVGGLFGACGGTTTVSNCSSSGVVAETGLSNGNHIGGLAGRLSGGTMTGCSSTSTPVTAGSYVGGLVGEMTGGAMTLCQASATVTATNFVGGLIGEVDTAVGASVTQCKATGTVNGGVSCGGLIGQISQLQPVTVSECYATGTVNASGTQAGGLIGVSRTTLPISNCYARGNVISGSTRIGGLIGYVRDITDVNNCYATGDVTGTNEIGGLIGYFKGGTVNNSYAAGGTVTATANIPGGLIGTATSGSAVVNSYYSNNAASCVKSGSPTCSLVADPDDFHSAANAPATAWDTTTIWRLCGSDDGCLQWDAACAPCPTGCDCATAQLAVFDDICALTPAPSSGSAIEALIPGILDTALEANGCALDDPCRNDILTSLGLLP